MEDELIESEKKYHSIVDNSTDAILLTIPDGDVLSANAAACKMFDRTEEDIRRAGRSGLMDLSDPRLPAALEERKQTGRFRGELTFVRKDGSKFEGEISSVIFTDRKRHPLDEYDHPRYFRAQAGGRGPETARSFIQKIIRPCARNDLPVCKNRTGRIACRFPPMQLELFSAVFRKMSLMIILRSYMPYIRKTLTIF